MHAPHAAGATVDNRAAHKSASEHGAGAAARHEYLNGSLHSRLRMCIDSFDSIAGFCETQRAGVCVYVCVCVAHRLHSARITLDNKRVLTPPPGDASHRRAWTGGGRVC